MENVPFSKGYKDLIVWQKSMLLVACAYDLAKELPPDELYGLTTQLRRAAFSIPTNIAEGSRRRTQKDYRKFVFIAYGSGAEIETLLDVIEMFHYAPKNKIHDVRSILTEIMRMLNALTKSLSTGKNPYRL